MILALDIATQTGVALGHRDATPDHWTVDWSDCGTAPAKFGAVLTLMRRTFRDNPTIDKVVIEKPQIRQGRDDWSLAYFLNGMVACACGEVALRNIHPTLVPTGMMDRHFIGKGRMKRDDRKRAIMTRCRQLGWKPRTQDEADALALWHWAAHQ